MSDTRPVNLDLMTVRLPISAYASILHRVSAVIVWVGLAVLLALASFALASEASYIELSELLQTNFLLQFVVWGFLTALGYYCVATSKHIIQDLGFFEDKAGGKFISTLVLVLGAVIALLAGVYVWVL
jgi:succinate dehydrogenase / fumarate reductase cytochrome b subunit